MRFSHLFGVSLMVLALPAPASAQYQGQGEITFFSNRNFSGARFTVTGDRTNVRIPFTARSAILRQGDRWQVCSRTDYRNCTVIASSNRALNMNVRSARPMNYGNPGLPGPWRELARLQVRPGVQLDSAQVQLTNQRYRRIMVCAERNTVRLARFDAMFNNGERQTFRVPLTLRAGQCSQSLDLQGNDRRIRMMTFTYQGWNPAYRGAVVVVRGFER